MDPIAPVGKFTSNGSTVSNGGYTNKSFYYTATDAGDVPTIEYAVGEGAKNTVVFDREYRLKDKATVTISDEFDEMAMFGVYDEDGGMLAYLNLDQNYLFEESGKYTVRAVNHAGETSDFVLYISLDAPKIKGAENKADKRFTIDITNSEVKKGYFYEQDKGEIHFANFALFPARNGILVFACYIVLK